MVRARSSYLPVFSARADRGVLMVELLVSMAILVLAVFPIAFHFLMEQRIVRDSYREAVVMEILDGEAEFLQAGAWRAVPEGNSDHPVNAEATVSLPPGRFIVLRSPGRLRLDWQPGPGVKLRPQFREFEIP